MLTTHISTNIEPAIRIIAQNNVYTQVRGV